MKRRSAAFAVLLLFAVPAAIAQITTVPMKGVGNEWVKELELHGRMDWEWIETYPEQVYFATRHEAERKGDIVTMWMRIEYKHPQNPLAHKSAMSRRQLGLRKAPALDCRRFLLQVEQPADGQARARAFDEPAALLGKGRARHHRRNAAQFRLQHPAGHAGHPAAEVTRRFKGDGHL